MTVTASDGSDIEHIEAGWLNIHSGETYDVYIEADQPTGKYWIRGETTDTYIPAGQTVRDFKLACQCMGYME